MSFGFRWMVKKFYGGMAPICYVQLSYNKCDNNAIIIASERMNLGIFGVFSLRHFVEQVVNPCLWPSFQIIRLITICELRPIFRAPSPL